jgi:serine/threonine-protein kinase
LGPYEILSPLGAGGMGEVYRAKDLKLGRNVAVKVLPSELASDAERLKRFQREARTASALNHPNIITIYAIDEHVAIHYIAMELVEGKTLRALMEDRLPTLKLLAIATQMAEGLAKAHSAGVFHRDLKPENVMVRDDGLVKILDFGLAKPMLASGDVDSRMDTLTRATRAGVILGTVQYMSPEQAAGRPSDYRSDQFSFGSILYEMATGKLAFKRETMPQTLAAIMDDEPEPMRRLNEEIPGELEAIVERCLSKSSADRYESTQDLAEELKKVPETSSMGERRPEAGSENVDSIAVLPFRNLSGDPGQEYLADGITEALIIDLAKVGALKVISRASVMRYKGTDKPPPKIGRELNIDAVVEGSAVRVGERVRITAQLIHAATDRLMWAESYERDFQDLLLVQSEVTQAITGEIKIVVTPEEGTRLAAARRVNPEAHEAYLRGRFHSYQFTPADLEKALEYYEQALQKDPEYALAYAGISQVWGWRLVLGVIPPREAGPKWLEMATKAVELDDTLAEAHGMLAQALTWNEWEWEGAETAFRRAIELNPNHGDALVFYGHYLAIVRGRFEDARGHIERALELDPLNSFYQGLYGIYLSWLPEYDEAIAQLQSALKTSPNFPLPRLGLWAAYSGKGMYEEALAEVKGLFAAFGDVEVVEALTRGEAEGGYSGAMGQAAETVAERARTFYIRPFLIAQLYGHAGQNDKAFEWLEKAIEARDHDCVYLSVFIVDPRYKDLLRRMNLPTTSARSDRDEQR